MLHHLLVESMDVEPQLAGASRVGNLTYDYKSHVDFQMLRGQIP